MTVALLAISIVALAGVVTALAVMLVKRADAHAATRIELAAEKGAGEDLARQLARRDEENRRQAAEIAGLYAELEEGDAHAPRDVASVRDRLRRRLRGGDTAGGVAPAGADRDMPEPAAAAPAVAGGIGHARLP